MKILLLGASGQIGYALTTALARSEHQVTVVVRNASLLSFPDTIRVIEQRELTADAFKAALQDVDHVIYGIGIPEQFLFDTGAFEKVNGELFATFLEALRISNVRKMTYISSYEAFEVIDGVIRETHPIADESHMTPYSQSKVRAYRAAVSFAKAHGVQLTTIHPAAVYGGLNTGDGITAYMENLRRWRVARLPFINAGNFPVIHVDSLTDLIIKALDKPGAYIASDLMTSLRGIAKAMRKQAPSYVPLVMPLAVVKLGVFAMETFAKVVPVKPLFSSVQLDFLTKGWRPEPAKASDELGWKPSTLERGIRQFLSRSRVPTGAEGVLSAASGQEMIPVETRSA